MGSGSTLLRLILDSHDTSRSRRRPGSCAPTTRTRTCRSKWSGRNWARRMGWTPRGARPGARRGTTTASSAATREPTASTAGRQDAVPHLARGGHGARVPGRGVHRDDPPPGWERRLEHGAARPLDPPRDRALGKYDREIVRQAADTATASPRPLRGARAAPGAGAAGAMLDWPASSWSRERARAPRGPGRPRRQAHGRGPQDPDHDPIDVLADHKWRPEDGGGPPAVAADGASDPLGGVPRLRDGRPGDARADGARRRPADPRHPPRRP